YCALIGGWLALLGWALGRLDELYWAPPFLSEDHLVIWKQAWKGLWLGLCVALGLALVDAFWDLGVPTSIGAVTRVLTAALVGAFGGLFGGALGQFLLRMTSDPTSTNATVLVVAGWSLTGVLIGFAIGAFDILKSRLKPDDRPAARRKVFRATFG